jgi:hypothetical protein
VSTLLAIPTVTAVFNIYHPPASVCPSPGPNQPPPQNCPQWADRLNTFLINTPNDFQASQAGQTTVFNPVTQQFPLYPTSAGPTNPINLYVGVGRLWQNVGTIIIDQQLNHIMDWTPNVYSGPVFRTLAFWTFTQSDLQNLCVQCNTFKP